jgi:phosphoenolpyruvate carboxykinase (ATP)
MDRCGYGVGSRMKLRYTRSMITAALEGKLPESDMRIDEVFGLKVPTSCPDVPVDVLTPRNTWEDKSAYDAAAMDLAKRFVTNFKKFDNTATDAMRSGGPRVAVKAS